MADIRDVAQDSLLSLTVGGAGSAISSVGGFGDLVLGNAKPNPVTAFGFDLRAKARANWASEYRRRRSAAYDDLEKRRGSLDAMGVYPAEGTYRCFENVLPGLLVGGVFSRLLSPGAGFLAASSLAEAGLQGGQAYGEQVEQGKVGKRAYDEALRQGTVSLAANVVSGAGSMGISSLARKVPYSFAAEWAEGVLNNGFQRVDEFHAVPRPALPDIPVLPSREELDETYARSAQERKSADPDYVCDENGCVRKDVYKRMRGIP